MSVSAFLPLSVWAECDNDTNNQPNQPIEYAKGVVINEILPNPSGDESSEEFIELYNSSNKKIDINGWILSDATTKEYKLEDYINAGQYLTVYREVSSIALNNSGDLVELFHPDKNLVDIVEYEESAADDVSFAMDKNNDWLWTTELTPGRKNIISAQGDADANSGTDNSDTDPLVPSYDFSTDIMLSEILPDPEGSDATDEWIEITNQGKASVGLYGWQITDASKTFTISEDISLSAGEYLTFSVTETGVSLNNSGETISLLDPAGEVISEVVYDTSFTGQSYANVDDQWYWTITLTPGEENIITDEADTNIDVSNANTIMATSSMSGALLIEHYAIMAAKQLPKGEEIIIEGVVNSLPDMYGSQYFYVQDDTAGIQVYSSKKLFPQLALGDKLQISGKTSESKEEKKINITSADDIVVLEHENELVELDILEYSEDYLGKLVHVSGEVVEKSGSTIVLDNNWNIYLKRGTGIKASTYEEGEHIEVIGVLTATTDGIRILPRSTDDIAQLTQEKIVAETTSNKIIKTAHATSNNDYDVSASEPIKKPNSVIWFVILGIVISLLLVLSRSEKLRSLLHNRLVHWAHSLASRFYHWVEVRKNTMDSNDQTQYHAQSVSERKMS